MPNSTTSETTPPSGSLTHIRAQHSKSELKMIHGIYCMHLVGNEVERAEQHGYWYRTLKNSKPFDFTLNALANKNQNLIYKAAKVNFLSKIYENFVLQFMTRNLPKQLLKLLKSFAKEMNIPEKTAWLALYQPDMLMILAGSTNEKTKNLFLEGLPACSSSIINRTENHPFYFARNLDYPAASVWEKWPTVFYHDSTDSLSYTSIASFGILPAGLTAVNECGIAFSLHAHFSKRVSFKGIPILFLGDQIMQQAHTLDEAIQIAKKFKVIGSWAVNIASFKENKSASLELAEGKVLVRENNPQGHLSHTNFFHQKELQPNEIYFSGSVAEDLHARKQAIEKDFEANAQHYQLMDAFKLLSQHQDSETGETRVFGSTMSVVTTIQSVVFDPDHSSLYISNRDETPTALGPYVRLPLKWDSQFQPEEPIEIQHSLSKNFLKSLHAYHHAYAGWQVHHQSASQVREYLIQAVSEFPSDAHLHMQKGYFDLMTDHFHEALESFTQATQKPLSQHHQSVAKYFLANSYDVLHQREQALKIYRELKDETALNPKLKKKVARRLKKPLSKRQTKKIIPDMQFPEPLEYA